MYAPDGTVISRGNFKKGERCGIWELKDPENGSELRGEMKGGLRVGDWEMKDEANKLTVKFSYDEKGQMKSAVTNRWE